MPGPKKSLVRSVMVHASTAGRGVDAANRAALQARQAWRNFSSPPAVLRRRVRVARTRRTAWAVLATGSGAGLAYQVVTLLSSGVTAFLIATSLILLVIFGRSVVGLVRAVIDIRTRTAQLESLPPAPPPRRPGVGAVAVEVERLDRYSDSLRSLVTLIGLDATAPDTAELRSDIISAADAAERGIRAQAVRYEDLTNAAAAAPMEAAAPLERTADDLARSIATEVAGYGDLVTAAGEAVSAGDQLRRDSALPSGTDEVTRRLSALAEGMRVLLR